MEMEITDLYLNDLLALYYNFELLSLTITFQNPGHYLFSFSFYDV